MRRTIIFSMAVAAMMLWNAAPAASIQDGTIDTRPYRYPNVLCVSTQSVPDEFIFVPGSVCATGELIAPGVVLTAGHLTIFQDVYGYPLRVSADATVPLDADPSTMIPVVRAVTHPGFFGSSGWKHDIGVLILARPINGVPLVEVPEEGLLDDLQAQYGSMDEIPLTAVGYGLQADAGGNWILDTQHRRYGPAVTGGGLPAQWFNLDFAESGITPGDKRRCDLLQRHVHGRRHVQHAPGYVVAKVVPGAVLHVAVAGRWSAPTE